MDPLVCAGGVRGHALLIDFSTLSARQVPIPEDASSWSSTRGQRRTLRTSPYAARVAECEAAAAVIGPLGAAAGRRSDRRSRPAPAPAGPPRGHRVPPGPAVSTRLAGDDLVGAGALMIESHRSLAEDFDVSTPAARRSGGPAGRPPGVFGARMTGAGFGGCVVALSRPGPSTSTRPTPAWRVEAATAPWPGAGGLD